PRTCSSESRACRPQIGRRRLSRNGKGAARPDATFPVSIQPIGFVIKSVRPILTLPPFVSVVFLHLGLCNQNVCKPAESIMSVHARQPGAPGHELGQIPIDAEAPLLTEDERRRVLYEWNATQLAYPRHTCMHELFAAQ